jgi:hypothetical protein
MNNIVQYEEAPSSLKDVLKGITGTPRRYLVLRISGVDKDKALEMVQSDKWGLASWKRSPLFLEIHQNVEHWKAEFKADAIKMVRRSTQLMAALFEREIIDRLFEELISGEYLLMKTQLAKEVYSKLINDLDTAPAVQHNTWEQIIGRLNVGGEGNVNTTPETSTNAEHQKSLDKVAKFQSRIQSVEDTVTDGDFTEEAEGVSEEIEDDEE